MPDGRSSAAPLPTVDTRLRVLSSRGWPRHFRRSERCRPHRHHRSSERRVLDDQEGRTMCLSPIVGSSSHDITSASSCRPHPDNRIDVDHERSVAATGLTDFASSACPRSTRCAAGTGASRCFSSIRRASPRSTMTSPLAPSQLPLGGCSADATTATVPTRLCHPGSFEPPTPRRGSFELSISPTRPPLRFSELVAHRARVRPPLTAR